MAVRRRDMAAPTGSCRTSSRRHNGQHRHGGSRCLRRPTPSRLSRGDERSAEAHPRTAIDRAPGAFRAWESRARGTAGRDPDQSILRGDLTGGGSAIDDLGRPALADGYRLSGKFIGTLSEPSVGRLRAQLPLGRRGRLADNHRRSTTVRTLPNRAPMAVGPIPGQTVEVGRAATVDLAPYFTDLVGDPVSCGVSGVDRRERCAPVLSATARGSGESLPAGSNSFLSRCGSWTEGRPVRERRDQLEPPVYAKPELVATPPHQRRSWQITRLLGPIRRNNGPGQKAGPVLRMIASLQPDPGRDP